MAVNLALCYVGMPMSVLVSAEFGICTLVYGFALLGGLGAYSSASIQQMRTASEAFQLMAISLEAYEPAASR